MYNKIYVKATRVVSTMENYFHICHYMAHNSITFWGTHRARLCMCVCVMRATVVAWHGVAIVWHVCVRTVIDQCIVYIRLHPCTVCTRLIQAVPHSCSKYNTHNYKYYILIYWVEWRGEKSLHLHRIIAHEFLSQLIWFIDVFSFSPFPLPPLRFDVIVWLIHVSSIWWVEKTRKKKKCSPRIRASVRNSSNRSTETQCLRTFIRRKRSRMQDKEGIISYWQRRAEARDFAVSPK